MAVAVSSIEKWQELGHHLNIDPEKLSNLFKSGRNGVECRDEMMTYWEEHDEGASWEKLARALSRMGENQLAQKIINEHTNTPTHSSTDGQLPPNNKSLSGIKTHIRHVRT